MIVIALHAPPPPPPRQLHDKLPCEDELDVFLEIHLSAWLVEALVQRPSPCLLTVLLVPQEDWRPELNNV